MKLDKTVHKAYNFKDQESDSENYKELSFEERVVVFNYLQSVTYGFPLNKYPRMNKTIHSSRKN